MGTSSQASCHQNVPRCPFLQQLLGLCSCSFPEPGPELDVLPGPAPLVLLLLSPWACLQLWRSGTGCKGRPWALRAAFCISRHRACVGLSAVTKPGGSFIPEASHTWSLPLNRSSGRAQSHSPVYLAYGLTPPCLLPSRYTLSCRGASALASVRLVLGWLRPGPSLPPAEWRQLRMANIPSKPQVKELRCPPAPLAATGTEGMGFGPRVGSAPELKLRNFTLCYLTFERSCPSRMYVL